MKPTDPIKIVSQLLDLPLIDPNGNYCGIVDDVELDGSAGKDTRLAALLVGPGAYRGRMPVWAMWLVRKIAGDRCTRVPIAKVESIDSAVHLKVPAEALGLHEIENRVRGHIPRAEPCDAAHAIFATRGRTLDGSGWDECTKSIATAAA